MLPVEPFRIWLREIVERYGSPENAEGAVGLSARTIRRFTNPKGIYEVTQELVSLDIVDAAVTHEGSCFLWDVYPLLYPDDPGDPQLSFADESWDFEAFLGSVAANKKSASMLAAKKRSPRANKTWGAKLFDEDPPQKKYVAGD